MRRPRFALICSLTTPAGRCVASTRCTPSPRPRCATDTSASSTEGCSRASAANSSTTTTSRANGSRRSSGRRASALRCSSRSLEPLLRSTRSRRRSSASSERTVRVVNAGERSVSAPTVWGSSASRSNARPPLKSISRNVSSSGPALRARAATSVRRSSLLPEPVVPATRRCGPSAARSTRKGPSAPTPSVSCVGGPARSVPGGLPAPRGRFVEVEQPDVARDRGAAGRTPVGVVQARERARGGLGAPTGEAFDADAGDPLRDARPGERGRPVRVGELDDRGDCGGKQVHPRSEHERPDAGAGPGSVRLRRVLPSPLIDLDAAQHRHRHRVGDRGRAPVGQPAGPVPGLVLGCHVECEVGWTAFGRGTDHHRPGKAPREGSRPDDADDGAASQVDLDGHVAEPHPVRRAAGSRVEPPHRAGTRRRPPAAAPRPGRRGRSATGAGRRRRTRRRHSEPVGSRPDRRMVARSGASSRRRSASSRVASASAAWKRAAASR